LSVRKNKLSLFDQHMLLRRIAIAVESILFDLDGTLVDSVPGIEFALTVATREILPERITQLKDIRSHIGPTLHDLVVQLFPDITADVMQKLERRFKLAYDESGWQKTIIYNGVIDTLEFFAGQGIACYIVTNKRFNPTQKIVEKLGLAGYLQDIVAPDVDEMFFQSKAEMVIYLVKKQSLVTAKTLMVGDTKNDALAAQQCAMAFAFAAYGYGDIQEIDGLPLAAVLDQPYDLCNLFQRKNIR